MEKVRDVETETGDDTSEVASVNGFCMMTPPVLFPLRPHQRLMGGFHFAPEASPTLVVWDLFLVHNFHFSLNHSTGGRTSAGVCVQKRKRERF